MTTITHWTDTLIGLDACSEAVQWAEDYANLDDAWANCERGDWMLWLIGKTIAAPKDSDNRKRLVLCACACARLALPHVKTGELRPLRAIETAERWARDEGATLADMRAAADAAAYAADAGAAAYAADAAAAAAYVAYAADAAYAGAAAPYAPYARASTLKACADIVRQHYPTPPQIGAQP